VANATVEPPEEENIAITVNRGESHLDGFALSKDKKSKIVQNSD
jgi:hypothetical protein